VVDNKKYHDNRKGRNAAGAFFRVNFADIIQQLCSKVTCDDFIWSVTLTSGIVPYIILYSERQISEIRSFCFNSDTGSVLSCDKIYNLGKLFVTVTVYVNFALKRISSGDVPIFIGPVFIHGNSDFESYAHFFGHLSARLVSCDFMQLRFGSDEEQAIRKAFSHCFHGATLVTCTRHLKENLRRDAFKVIMQNCYFVF
jgi:hypothetical protein